MFYTYNYEHLFKDTSVYREIRKRECENYRDEKARKMIAELQRQRKEQNKPSPREPVLVCRSMKHLPASPLKKNSGIV